MRRHGFSRRRDGSVVLRLDELEREILSGLVGRLLELVTPEPLDDTDPLARMVGIDPDAERPDDPALARLFPDAYDDDESATEFRRFTERSLRDAKIANARAVAATLDEGGDEIDLDDEQTRAWLGTLNDLRLTVASRLGIEEDNHDLFLDLPEDHPARALYSAYDWMTALQEALVRALSGLRSEPPPGAAP